MVFGHSKTSPRNLKPVNHKIRIIRIARGWFFKTCAIRLSVARSIALKTFQVSTNGVDLKTGLPTRLKLLSWGKNRLNTGEDVEVNEVSAKVFANNQRTMGRETVPIDYEHSTVPGTPAFERSKASDPVAGNGRPVVIPGEGLFIEGVETSPDGLKNAANFKDLSPAPLVENGVVVGMHSLALTHAGAVEGLTLSDAAIQALSANCNLKSFSTDSIPNAYKNGEERNYGYNAMDLTKVRELDKDGETKGMSDEATVAWVIAKWCGMCGKDGPITPKSMNQVVQFDDHWAAELDKRVEAAIKPLTASLETMTAAAKSRKDADEAAEKTRVIADAQRDGKVVALTAEQISGFSLDNLKVFTAALPKGVIPRAPLQPIGQGQRIVKPLSACKEDERQSALEANRIRTLDATANLVASIRRGNN